MCNDAKGCSNEFECPCANTACENYKVCCACVNNHREQGNLPCCFRPAE